MAKGRWEAEAEALVRDWYRASGVSGRIVSWGTHDQDLITRLTAFADRIATESAREALAQAAGMPIAVTDDPTMTRAERRAFEAGMSETSRQWRMALSALAKSTPAAPASPGAGDRETERDEVVHWAQAVLTALNTGDVQRGSALHHKLREVMIAYRTARRGEGGA